MQASRISTDVLLSEWHEQSRSRIQIDVGSVIGFDNAIIDNIAREAEGILSIPTTLNEYAKRIIIRHFTRPNAIKNQYATLAEYLQTSSQGDKLLTLNMRYQAWIQDNGLHWNIASFSDPASAIFMENALPTAKYFNLMMRSMQTKSVLRRLHQLRLNIRHECIRDNNIQRFIDDNNDIANAADQSSISWDATTRVLYVPASWRANGRLELPL